MFDFWKEVIINNGTLPETEGVDKNGELFQRVYAMDPVEEPFNGVTEKTFRVLRCADYKKSGFVDGYDVAEGTYGTCEVARAYITDESPGQYRIKLELGLKQKYDSDYAGAWSNFKKTFITEYALSDDILTAVDRADVIEKALSLADAANYHLAYSVTPANSSNANTSILFTCLDPHMVITSFVIEKLDFAECGNTCSDVEYRVIETGNTLTQSELPFATGEWLIENLRFPSYPNLRYEAVNADERPIPGKLYKQITFDYCVPRRGYTGQGAVGQMINSVTHHVFYVLDEIDPSVDETKTLADYFIAELDKVLA